MRNKRIKINQPNKPSKEIIIEATLKGSKEITKDIIPVDKIDKAQLAKYNKEPYNAKPHYDTKININEDCADFEGKWSWGIIRDWRKDKNHYSQIDKFKKDFNNKLWKDIFGEKTGTKTKNKKKHFYYSVKKIHKEAQKRLREIEFDDFEEIFRFRLTNLFRFYGLTVGNVFIALWHDPQHKIYPRD